MIEVTRKCTECGEDYTVSADGTMPLCHSCYLKKRRPTTKEKQCFNKCPYCGSEVIEWRDNYLSDDYYVYKGVCLDCDKSFKEYHKLVYECTEYEEE